MDCSKTLNFLMAQKRICRSRGVCQALDGGYCPLYAFCNYDPNNYSVAKVKEAIETTQKWIAEHPEKTYAQDFLEKFPKAKPDANGVPRICRIRCYGGSCRQSAIFGAGQKSCKDCWNEEMEAADDE